MSSRDPPTASGRGAVLRLGGAAEWVADIGGVLTGKGDVAVSGYGTPRFDPLHRFLDVQSPGWNGAFPPVTDASVASLPLSI